MDLLSIFFDLWTCPVSNPIGFWTIQDKCLVRNSPKWTIPDIGQTKKDFKMKIKKLIPTEHQEAVKFVEWLKYHPSIWEASQTSANQAICYSHAGTRQKLAAEGLKAGEPDFNIRIMKNGYGGLFIELKKTSDLGKPLRNEQKDMHNILRKNGYAVFVAYGADECIEIVKNYLS